MLLSVPPVYLCSPVNGTATANYFKTVLFAVEVHCFLSKSSSVLVSLQKTANLSFFVQVKVRVSILKRLPSKVFLHKDRMNKECSLNCPIFSRSGKVLDLIKYFIQFLDSGLFQDSNRTQKFEAHHCENIKTMVFCPNNFSNKSFYKSQDKQQKLSVVRKEDVSLTRFINLLCCLWLPYG